MARDLKDLEVELAAQGFSLIWYVGLHHPSSDHTHPATNLTPAVIASFADETDLVATALLQRFNAPIISMGNIAFRQAVGRTQVDYLTIPRIVRHLSAQPYRRGQGKGSR